MLTCLNRVHSVWGRVVPDIPDYGRELFAALPEDSSILEPTSRDP